MESEETISRGCRAAFPSQDLANLRPRIFLDSEWLFRDCARMVEWGPGEEKLLRCFSAFAPYVHMYIVQRDIQASDRARSAAIAHMA